ncbi:hypothetical protein OOT00_12780, partial [Desulfobotulus sp. H1]
MSHNDSKGGVYPSPAQAQPPSGTTGQGHGHMTEHATGQISDVGMQGASMTFGSAQPGPDMGQPHYASQIPGAAPYQGAPLSPEETQARYAWGEKQSPEMTIPADSVGNEKQGGYGKEETVSTDAGGCTDAAAQPYPAPGQPPQFP